MPSQANSETGDSRIRIQALPENRPSLF